MNITQSRASDEQEIFNLHYSAFDPVERETVAQLAIDLLQDPSASPQYSLIALSNNEIVGHVLFTKISTEKSPNIEGAILAPLAVDPSFQKQGIGKDLINRGIQLLEARGVAYIMVLGDPQYYSKSGFHTNHKVKPPFQIPYPEAWMALGLTDGVLKKTSGTIRCADALNKRSLW